jgi:hypothetical protein
VGAISLKLPGQQSINGVTTDTVVPGDSGRVQFQLANTGDAVAAGGVALNFYASSTGMIDSSAIPIAVPQLASRNVRVGAGKMLAVSSSFVLPGMMTPGTYYIVAQAAAAAGSTVAPRDVSSSPVVILSPITVAWSFGLVGPRKNVKFVGYLSSGATVKYQLTGMSTGTVTEGAGPLTLNGGPDFTVSISGNDPTSRLTITQRGSSASNIIALSITGPLASADLREDTPNSITTTTGSALPRLMIGSIPIAHPRSGASGYASDVPGNVALAEPALRFSADQVNGSIVLGSSNDQQSSAITIGDIESGCNLQSADSIGSLRIGAAAAGSLISAPSIAKLTCTGDFDAGLTITGTTTGAMVLGNVAVGGSVIGSAIGTDRWAVNGNIGTIRIAGSVTDLQLLGGAAVGPSGSLASPPASFTATSIQSVAVGGSVNSSLLAAGLDPVDGMLLNGNDRLLAGGSIGSLIINGELGTDSKVVADFPPAIAIIGKSRVQTSNDTRFQLFITFQ